MGNTDLFKQFIKVKLSQMSRC